MFDKSKANIDEKIEYHVSELMNLLADSPDKMLALVKDSFKKAGLFSMSLFEDDTDINNKKEIYAHITNFIGEHFNLPHRLLLNLTCELCSETDSSVINTNDLSRKELAEVSKLFPKVEDFVISIKVSYEVSPESLVEKSIRLTEIWYMRSKKPANKSYRVEMDWEELPSEIRESYIRSNERETTFKLYPEE